MKPTQTEMNSDLLERAGYEWFTTGRGSPSFLEKPENNEGYWHPCERPDNLDNDDYFHSVPDYFTDRNALWELEEKMSDEEKIRYEEEVGYYTFSGGYNSRFWSARHTPTDVLAEAAWKATRVEDK